MMTIQAGNPVVRLFALVPVLLLLQACGADDSDYDFEGSRAGFEQEFDENAPAQALYDPAAETPVLPFPNDLLFAGSTDGTLNIPVADPDDASDPTVVLNQLDGFSTVAPISTALSGPVDPASLAIGSGVRVFEVALSPEGAVAGITRELEADEIVATTSDDSLVLLPLVPLAPATGHMVVLTDGITEPAPAAEGGDDTDGAEDADGAEGDAGEAADAGAAPAARPLTASLTYRLTKSGTAFTSEQLLPLEPLRQLTNAQLAAAAGAGIERDSVVLSWTFRTQSIREPLQAAKDLVAPSALVLAPTGQSTSDAVPLLQGKADLWIGTLELPYYQTAADPDDPASFAAALNGVWRNAAGEPVNPTDFTPVATATVTVPVLVTVPNSTAAAGDVPDGGWPVSIFQHGITRNRTDMLALADAMADAGRVLFAIDQPLHGLTATDPEGDGYALSAAVSPFPDDVERTFGIDVANNDTGEAGPDGTIDESGTYFYNLRNLANSRDNLRQAAADLLTLSASLGGALVADGEGGAAPAGDAGLPLNAVDKSFVGHSLGGIVGATMLSYDDSFRAASLAMPGGGIAQLLANSESIGPTIDAGLAAAGVETGSPEYQRFLLVAQTAVDSGDPINHARFLDEANVPAVHLIQVNGDRTIPNAVPSAPLSGTEPLARQLGLPPVDAGTTGDAWVRFSAGDHGSIISPLASPAATVEMQRQVATFAASQGTQLPITDDSVIAPVDGQ